MCGPHQHRGRHFFTSDEQVEMLERYKEWLTKETQGVEEAIDKIKKAS